MRASPAKPNICRLFAMLAISIALTACSSEPKLQGDGLVMAKYSMRTLSADLGADIRVPALMAAAEVALSKRGYSISSNRVTEDAGRVQGAKPGSSGNDNVVVSAAITAQGTRVKVTAKPWGDEAISRAILDDLLLHLGY